jgi:hypothetical protein
MQAKVQRLMQSEIIGVMDPRTLNGRQLIRIKVGEVGWQILPDAWVFKCVCLNTESAVRELLMGTFQEDIGLLEIVLFSDLLVFSSLSIIMVLGNYHLRSQ